MVPPSQKQTARDRVAERVGGKWRLDKLVALGGMAAVYAVTHEAGPSAALKIMHAELCQDEALRKRFLREVAIAKAIEHPSVVRVLEDHRTQAGEPFLVMEPLRGATLSSVWRRHGKKVSVDASLRITAQILAVLVAFHEKGIVYRNLEPANVFVTKRGVVKILDLGVLQHRDATAEMRIAGLRTGNASFMAPECAAGRRDDIDHRADVFAVGATLYTLVSGKRLHRGKTAQESRVLARTQSAPSVARAAPELSEAAVAFIDKALAWKRGDRFQSSRAMLQAVNELLEPAELVPSERPPTSSPAEELVVELDLAAGSSIAAVASALAPGQVRSRDSEAFPVDSVEIQRASSPEVVVVSPVPERRATLELPATIEEVALPAHDPLTPVLVSLDGLLGSAREHGPAHPQTQARITLFIEAMAKALEALPGGVHLQVMPFGLMRDGQTVWEPSPPRDLVPYALSVAGLRELRISQGVHEYELRALLGVMMSEAHGDPTAVASQLWGATWPHIVCRIAHELDAEQAETVDAMFSEAEELEGDLEVQLAAVLGAPPGTSHEHEMFVAAMATRQEASENTTALLRLDEAARERLVQATRVPFAEWSARHAEVLIDAFEDAAGRGDTTVWVAAIGAHARRLWRAGRDEALFDLQHSIVARLSVGGQHAQRLTSAFVTASLFPRDVLEQVVSTATSESALVDAARTERAVTGFTSILEAMNRQALPTFLALADRVAEGPLLAPIVSYVVRVAAGEEEIVMRHLDKLSPQIARTLLAGLIASGGDAVNKRLRPLLKSDNRALRCEATAQLAPSQAVLSQELMKLFAGNDRALRSEVLHTLVRHKVRAAGPRLLAIVEDEGFIERAADEQEGMLNALWALNPARAEKLLSELVARHGLMKNDELDRTRGIAVRMLSERGYTQRALEALQGAEARRPWNSADLREAAAVAIKILLARTAPAEAPQDRQPPDGASEA